MNDKYDDDFQFEEQIDLVMKENITIEDYRLHYQVLVGDIRESKAGQWRISNYGLLAQAAAASVFSIVIKNPPIGDVIWWKLGIFPISVIICFVAIFFIFKDRARIENCRNQTERYPRPYNTQKKRDPRQDRPILRLFFGAQVIGSILAIIYIFSVT